MEDTNTSFLASIKEFEKIPNFNDVFVNQGKRTLERLEKENLGLNSWVQKRGSGYMVKFGRLPKRYFVQSAEQAKTLVQGAIDAIRAGDPELVALVKQHYPLPQRLTPGSHTAKKKVTAATLKEVPKEAPKSTAKPAKVTKPAKANTKAAA